MASIRLTRVASELRIRKRRLSAYQRAPDWPGKGMSWASELRHYDRLLVLAAGMLEVPVPAVPDGEPYPPEVRAVLEDRLSAAGMDIWAPHPGSGDIVQDGDLII